MYARKRDALHWEIAEQLTELGFFVADTSGCTSCPGYPDMHISKNGFSALVELKTPANPTAKARQTPAERLRASQKAFRDRWKGQPIIVAYDLNTVLFDWNLLTKRYRSL